MNRSVAIILAILIAISMAHQTRLFFLSFQPPFSEEGAVATKSEIKAGEALPVRYKFRRNRYCDSRINWFAVNKSNDEVVWRLQVVGGATLLGPQSVLNQVPVPALPAAEYILHTISISLCSEGQHVLVYPDIDFTVH